MICMDMCVCGAEEKDSVPLLQLSYRSRSASPRDMNAKRAASAPSENPLLRHDSCQFVSSVGSRTNPVAALLTATVNQNGHLDTPPSNTLPLHFSPLSSLHLPRITIREGGGACLHTVALIGSKRMRFSFPLLSPENTHLNLRSDIC